MIVWILHSKNTCKFRPGKEKLILLILVAGDNIQDVLTSRRVL